MVNREGRELRNEMDVGKGAHGRGRREWQCSGKGKIIHFYYLDGGYCWCGKEMGSVRERDGGTWHLIR